jgi:hypothetical protein
MASPRSWEHVDLIISAAFGHWEAPGQNVCIFTPKRNATFLSIQSIVTYWTRHSQPSSWSPIAARSDLTSFVLCLIILPKHLPTPSPITPSDLTKTQSQRLTIEWRSLLQATVLGCPLWSVDLTCSGPSIERPAIS